MRFTISKNAAEQKSIELDLQGAKVDASIDIDQLRYFKTKAYQGIDGNKFDTILGLPNKFMATLNIEDSSKLATAFITAHYLIISNLGPNSNQDNPGTQPGDRIIQLENALDVLITRLDQDIDLFPKLLDFTIANVQFPSFKDAGTRAQDSEAMTFHRDEVVSLTAIAILGKLLAPIFVDFMSYAVGEPLLLENNLKVTHCVAMLKTILNKRAGRLINKLYEYIRNLLKPTCSQVTETNIYNGLTSAVHIQKQYAELLVKRLVTVDITRTSQSNILKYVASTIKTPIGQNSGQKNTPSASSLIVPGDNNESSLDTEGNTSVFENESLVSSKPADSAILVIEAIKQSKALFAEQYNLDLAKIEALENYYKIYHVGLTAINSYILGILFGSYIAGSKSVELLDNDSLVTLVACAQVYFASHGPTSLIHVISAIPTDTVKTERSSNDVLLINNATTTIEYKNCCERFKYEFGSLKWSSGMMDIIKELTSRIYIYNTEPSLWEFLGEGNANGNPLQTPLIAQDICKLILEVYS